MKNFFKKIWDTIGSWIFVATIILVPVIMIIIGIAGTIQEFSEPWRADVDDSYYERYDEGYHDGVAMAQQYIATITDFELSDMEQDIEKQYGMNPYEAVELLTNYADSPDEATKEEVNNAIWAVYRYYFCSQEVINKIEDFDIQ